MNAFAWYITDLSPPSRIGAQGSQCLACGSVRSAGGGEGRLASGAWNSPSHHLPAMPATMRTALGTATVIEEGDNLVLHISPESWATFHIGILTFRVQWRGPVKASPVTFALGPNGRVALLLRR
jgi:hypothetical protein